jgi:FlaA1/EpsC-like NDP-sugar epimerase
MAVEEAASLVIQAASFAEQGQIFILDMGEPIRIVDLARDLITLSGLRPVDDIEIRFCGIRPGEKLFEELTTDAEHADKTKHPKVFIGRIKSHDLSAISDGVAALCDLARQGHGERLRTALADIVPEYGATRAQRPSLRTTGTSPARDFPDSN